MNTFTKTFGPSKKALQRLSPGLLFLLLVFSGVAQPAGYYDAAAGKTGALLQVALYNIIKNHNAVSYTPGVWNAFYTTDPRPDNGKVWDMYSDIPGGTPPYYYTFGTNQCGTANSEGDCYSREHSFCQSYFAGATPMYTDLNHLFPTDQYVNNRHSNNPYGTVGTATWTSLNGSKVGPCSASGYSGTVFEPRNEYKGDFARAYFYMATRYQNIIGTWMNNSTETQAFLDGASYPAYKTWFLNLLLAWNSSDPVDAKEIARNNAVYAIQNNRNPYIDHPEYVTAVWQPSGPKAEPTNHATAFAGAAGSPSYSAITLNWTDATGAVLPDGYLVKGSTVSLADITNPADGVAVSDGGLNKNVIYGTHTTTFSGLTASTTYYFKIYSYTNSGTDINYKTDGTIQSASQATTAGASGLAAGDIAIIEADTYDPDRISFITMKQISSGTIINFTDNGYSHDTVRTTEGVISYTVPTTLAPGTVVSWYSGMALPGSGWSNVSGSFSLSQSGDQVFAFQGTWGSGHILLYGISIGNASWQTTGTATSNTSYLPAVLTSNVNALLITANNGYYNLITAGSANALGSLAAYPANWTTSAANMPSPAWSFNLGSTTSISTNSTIQNLTIASGETVTIPVGKQLTVNGAISNSNGNGGLVIASDATGTGSLIHNTDYVPASVNRYITGVSYAWHLLSSPVSMTITGSDFVPGGSGYDFYCWNEPTGEWVNFKNTTVEPTWLTANGSNDFVGGQGYLVAYETTGQTKQYAGLLNNGTISFDLTKAVSGSWVGYNLAGNPYPSAIDWKAASGWTRTSLLTSGTGKDMWIWNETAGNYGVYNSVDADDNGTNSVTRYIPVGQGFFVQASAAGALSMTNSVRVHQNPVYLKSANKLSDILRLKVTSAVNPYSDEVVVEFGHETSQGGGHKMFSMYADAPGLYLLKENEKYSIDFLGVPSPQNVTLCLVPGVEGSHTIAASMLNTFHEGTVITLEDLKTGNSQDLMKEPAYTFSAAINDDANRFMLRFGGSIGIGETTAENPTTIYSSGSTIYVWDKTGKRQGEVFVYNLMGQQIASAKLNGNSKFELRLNAPTGYYLVKMITSETLQTKKIFIP